MSNVISLTQPTISLREILRKYVAEQVPGTMLDYVAAEQATGVDMRPGVSGRWGRRALKDAVKAEKRTFEMVHGTGIRLLSAETAADSIQKDVYALSVKATRVQARSERVIEEHGANMNSSDRDRAVRYTSFLSTMKLSASLCAKGSAPKELKK